MDYQAIGKKALENVNQVPLGAIALTVINPWVGGAWVALQCGKAISDHFKAVDCSDAFYASFTHLCQCYGFEPMSRSKLVRAHDSLFRKGYVINCVDEESFAQWLDDLKAEDVALSATPKFNIVKEFMPALAS
jgi:hypothetical protein